MCACNNDLIARPWQCCIADPTGSIMSKREHCSICCNATAGCCFGPCCCAAFSTVALLNCIAYMILTCGHMICSQTCCYTGSCCENTCFKCSGIDEKAQHTGQLIPGNLQLSSAVDATWRAMAAGLWCICCPADICIVFCSGCRDPECHGSNTDTFMAQFTIAHEPSNNPVYQPCAYICCQPRGAYFAL